MANIKNLPTGNPVGIYLEMGVGYLSKHIILVFSWILVCVFRPFTHAYRTKTCHAFVGMIT